MIRVISILCLDAEEFLVLRVRPNDLVRQTAASELRAGVAPRAHYICRGLQLIELAGNGGQAEDDVARRILLNHERWHGKRRNFKHDVPGAGQNAVRDVRASYGDAQIVFTRRGETPIVMRMSGNAETDHVVITKSVCSGPGDDGISKRVILPRREIAGTGERT